MTITTERKAALIKEHARTEGGRPAGKTCNDRLNTHTGLSAYGHSGKLSTFSKVCRPMTSASTVAMNAA